MGGREAAPDPPWGNVVEDFWRRARRAVQQEKGIPGRGHSISKGTEARNRMSCVGNCAQSSVILDEVGENEGGDGRAPGHGGHVGSLTCLIAKKDFEGGEWSWIARNWAGGRGPSYESGDAPGEGLEAGEQELVCGGGRGL